MSYREQLKELAIQNEMTKKKESPKKVKMQEEQVKSGEENVAVEVKKVAKPINKRKFYAGANDEYNKLQIEKIQKFHDTLHFKQGKLPLTERNSKSQKQTSFTQSI